MVAHERRLFRWAVCGAGGMNGRKAGVLRLLFSLTCLILLCWGVPVRGSEVGKESAPEGAVGRLLRLHELRTGELQAHLRELRAALARLRTSQRSLRHQRERLRESRIALRQTLDRARRGRENIASRLGRERQRVERAVAPFLDRLRHPSAADRRVRRSELVLRALLLPLRERQAELSQAYERIRELVRLQAIQRRDLRAIAGVLHGGERRLATLDRELQQTGFAFQELRRRTRLAAQWDRRLLRIRRVRDGIAVFSRDWTAAESFAPPAPAELPAGRRLHAPRVVALVVRPAWRLAAALVPPATVRTRPSGTVRKNGVARFPVEGTIVSRFGDRGVGPFARGILIRADGSQAVRSPRRGRVVFAGPFREFGIVVVIDHGAGYHSLFAGLTRLASRKGQRIERGQVIGWLRDLGEGPRRIYVELRYQGRAIDPLPWLAAATDRVRG